MGLSEYDAVTTDEVLWDNYGNTVYWLMNSAQMWSLLREVSGGKAGELFWTGTL